MSPFLIGVPQIKKTRLELDRSVYLIFNLVYHGFVDVSFYTVPGPNKWDLKSDASFNGGWKYSFSSIGLLSKKNPSVRFHFLIAHLDTFGSIPTLPNYDNVTFEICTISINELEVKYRHHQSSQHGGLLNYLIQSHPPTTDFFCIIDPDFYVFGENIIIDLAKHIRDKDLTSIGVSYPVTLPLNNYWDFPTAYFQMFRTNAIQVSELDFRPDESSFVPDKSQRSGLGMPRHKMQKSVNFLFYRLTQIFTLLHFRLGLKICHTLLKLINNKILASKLSMVRDTGWLNREKLKYTKCEVIPYGIDTRKACKRFNVNEYFKLNPDLNKSQIDGFWHFINFGIFEGRKIGNQKMYWRILSKLFRNDSFDCSIHPVSSIFSVKLDSIEFEFSKPNQIFEQGFFYFWKEKLFALHLGHEAKSNDNSDLNFVRDLQNQI